MKESYKKGKYYRGLGYYLEKRKTYSVSCPTKPIEEHIFSTGEYDGGGAVILNRVLVK